MIQDVAGLGADVVRGGRTEDEGFFEGVGIWRRGVFYWKTFISLTRNIVTTVDQTR